MKISVPILSLALLIGGAGLSDAVAQVIRLGHIRNTDHPTHLAALEFAKLVEAESGGKFTVQVYPNSVLGGPKEMFVQMQTGDLQMVYGGINTFAWIDGGEPFEVTALPFLFRDYEHMKAALDADFFKPIIEKAEEETGIKIVAINGDTTPRGLTTTDRPVRKAEDFKGLKIRTASSPTVLKAMTTLGALPQQVPFSELYMALRTGVVDAQENGAMVVDSSSLYEVQKYYIKTDYIRDIETFYAGQDFWDELSPDDQKMIRSAADKAGEYETKLLHEQMSQVYDKLGKSMTVITDPDLNDIRDALAGAFDEFEGKLWPKGLVEEIKAVQ
ncbi:tripartite ATP-independent transporter solute receptor, DctP family [Consotaella salsifontis]|uniref:Tripartite ATP-independent transporter solute receptor, DctP family n=2 Tax=Consotaella salsifontis TaxID=1365950 RepID=A0A1T4RBA6_9HYPH|nr:tripartite ATP-independent transporter solute receptor, DctP family [Consotaella salsifontis]